jgi:hypothetical protein
MKKHRERERERERESERETFLWISNRQSSDFGRQGPEF